MNQKTFPFVPQPRWWHQYIGRLLWLANQDAKTWDDRERYGFYRLKTRLLERYAEEIGVHWQHIKHECWSCDGTGTWGYFHYDGGDYCWKCRGTGIYREFYVRLQVYQLGGFQFHVPGERRDTLDFEAVIIPGQILHTPQGPKAVWAYRALMLLFDRKELRRSAWAAVRSIVNRVIDKVRRQLPTRCHECGRWLIRKHAGACLTCCGNRKAGVLCKECEDLIPF